MLSESSTLLFLSLNEEGPPKGSSSRSSNNKKQNQSEVFLRFFQPFTLIYTDFIVYHEIRQFPLRTTLNERKEYYKMAENQSQNQNQDESNVEELKIEDLKVPKEILDKIIEQQVITISIQASNGSKI